MGQFDQYIYTIPKDYHFWGPNYVSPRAWFRGNQSMPGARLNMGFDVITHEHVAEYPHFHHSVEEYLFFTGSDLSKFFDFDAEIELWLGEDPDHLEKVVITEPTLVRIPPNHWHGPINYKRVGKPVAYSAAYLEGDYSKITRRTKPDGSVVYPYLESNLLRCVNDGSKTCAFCGKCFSEFAKNPEAAHHAELDYIQNWTNALIGGEPAPHSGKYDHLVFTYPVEYHQWGDTYANPRGKFKGIIQMPEAKFFGGFSVVLRSSLMEVPHIHHANDEYLWFTGSDLANFFDFDAEIELMMGWDPGNMEKVVITEPTVVRVPPNLWHCPINFKRIGKPVGFMPMYSDGDWSKILHSKDENGNDEYLFEAASLRKCVYSAQKICNYCGKCYVDRAAANKK